MVPVIVEAGGREALIQHLQDVYEVNDIEAKMVDFILELTLREQ